MSLASVGCGAAGGSGRLSCAMVRNGCLRRDWVLFGIKTSALGCTANARLANRADSRAVRPRAVA